MQAWRSLYTLGAAQKNTELCHFPPGNPDNFHTILVGPKAADKHVENHSGDFFGACCSAFEELCDDGNACTAPSCLDDFCGNTPVDCDDGVACTEDSCDEIAGCANVPKDANCGAGERYDSIAGCVTELSPCVTKSNCPDDDGDL